MEKKDFIQFHQIRYTVDKSKINPNPFIETPYVIEATYEYEVVPNSLKICYSDMQNTSKNTDNQDVIPKEEK